MIVASFQNQFSEDIDFKALINAETNMENSTYTSKRVFFFTNLLLSGENNLLMFSVECFPKEDALLRCWRRLLLYFDARGSILDPGNFSGSTALVTCVIHSG